jgi:hypothetical protein
VHAAAPAVSLTLDLFAPAQPSSGPRTPINTVVVVSTEVSEATLAALKPALERGLRALAPGDRLALVDSGLAGELRQGRGSELVSAEVLERVIGRVRALQTTSSATTGTMLSMGLELAALGSDGFARTRLLWLTTRDASSAEVDLDRLGRQLDATRKNGFDLVVVRLTPGAGFEAGEAQARRGGGRVLGFEAGALPSLVDLTPPRVLLAPRLLVTLGPGVSFAPGAEPRLAVDCADVFAGASVTRSLALTVAPPPGVTRLATATLEGEQPGGGQLSLRRELLIEVVG